MTIYLLQHDDTSQRRFIQQLPYLTGLGGNATTVNAMFILNIGRFKLITFHIFNIFFTFNFSFFTCLENMKLNVEKYMWRVLLMSRTLLRRRL